MENAAHPSHESPGERTTARLRPAPILLGAGRLLQGLAASAALSLTLAAHAATTYNIASTNMASAADGECTLVEALASASQNATVNECVSAGAPYTINLVPGTYSFMTKTYVDGNFGDTAVNVSAADVTINGNGATLNRGSGADTMRLFYIANSRSVTLNHVTVSGFNASNTAQPVAFWGGAFAMLQGFLNIEDSTISGNVCQTTGCDGAAIVAYVSTVNIHRSTIANNDGTSINIAQIRMTQNSNLNIGNSTFFGPRIGVSTTNGSTTYISSSTMSGQSALIFDPGGVANVQNSLLFNDCSMGGGTVNLFNSAAPFNCGGTQPAYTLKTAAFNGGLTQTRAILQGDFPQDKAPGCTYLSSPSNPLYTNGAPVTTDQRGAARDANCDLGAFELFSLSAIAPFAAQVQVPYSATVTATGAGPFTYAHTLGTLPPGLALAANGTLSGTPTTANNFTFEITATDSNGNTSTRRYTSFPVSKGNQTITFNAQAGQTYSPGGTFAVNPLASATSGLAPTYTSLTPGVCTVSLQTVTIVSAGTCTIRASQVGNVNFNAAAAVSQDVTISPANQTLTFGAQAGQVLVAGGTFAINPLATATSALAPVYSSTTPAVCTVTGTTVTMAGIVGTCTLAANQAGNGNYNAAPQVTTNVAITQGMQVITFGSLSPRALGTPPFAVAATGGPSGNAVTFTSLTPSVCTATGVNGATVTLLIAGTCTIRAAQAGNVNYLAAVAVNQSFLVGSGPSALGLASSANPAVYGTPVTFTATVSGVAPGGTVGFLNGIEPLCAAAPVVNNTAVCTTASLAEGGHAIAAYYSGDPNNNASSSQQFTQIVPKISAYQGAWWGGAAENGWGLSLIEHGNTLAVGWYYYDANGQPTWAIIPGCAFDAARTTCTGSVQTSTSSWFADYKTAAFTSKIVGTATIHFANTSAATFDYVVNGVAGHKTLSRIDLGSNPFAPFEFTDTWWGGPDQNGWGVAMYQANGALVGSWYTYKADGSPTWLLFNGGAWVNPTRFKANLVRATGAPMFGGAYDPAAFRPANAGELYLEFVDVNHAEMTYVLDGILQFKNIVKLRF